MQLSALFSLMKGDGTALYEYIKKESRQLAVSEAVKQLVPDLHKVADKGLRPDKKIFVPTGEKNEDGTDQMTIDFVPVTRAPLAIQKYIISQKGSFARGNGVVFKPSIENNIVYDNFYRNWKNNKTDFDLKEFATRQMGETQCAVIFYGEKGKESFDEFNFRYKVVSPLKGDKLYPFFDEDTDDLIAFGREYKRGKKTRYDLYVIDEKTQLCVIRRFEDKKPLQVIVPGENGLPDTTADLEIKTQFTKIPVIYWEQDEGECHDTAALIEEFEIGFSDFLTGLGYTADPILFAKGEVMDLPAKGSAGKFIESTDKDADLKYITPDNATEARELSFKMLQKFIFSLNRSVILDLDTLSSLGATSGAALERYLIDVYAEATDKQQGSWGKGVQRMVNFMVSQWVNLLNDTSGIRIDLQFTKFSLQDLLEKVELAMKANGNQPVVDLETSVGMAGLVDDVQDITNKIKKEQGQATPA